MDLESGGSLGRRGTRRRCLLKSQLGRRRLEGCRGGLLLRDNCCGGLERALSCGSLQRSLLLGHNRRRGLERDLIRCGSFNRLEILLCNRICNIRNTGPIIEHSALGAGAIARDCSTCLHLIHSARWALCATVLLGHLSTSLSISARLNCSQSRQPYWIGLTGETQIRVSFRTVGVTLASYKGKAGRTCRGGGGLKDKMLGCGSLEGRGGLGCRSLGHLEGRGGLLCRKRGRSRRRSRS